MKKLPAAQPNLEITIEYDDKENLIVISMTDDNRLISLGLNMQEAQLFCLTLTEVIGDAVLSNINLPTTPETRH